MQSENINFPIYTPIALASEADQNRIVDFLFKHLDQYGDKRADISKCFDFSMQRGQTLGGYVIEMQDGDKIIGATIINKTGMDGYIPENILVYIATHHDYRGKGLGKQLMQIAIKTVEGAIALHVEPDNPAKFLYEKLGFTNKYLEMRLQK